MVTFSLAGMIIFQRHRVAKSNGSTILYNTQSNTLGNFRGMLPQIPLRPRLSLLQGSAGPPIPKGYSGA